MSSIIIMAVHDTDDNKRTEYTKRTLKSLLETVDFDKHRLFISDNGSCNRTHKLLSEFSYSFSTIFPMDNLIISFNNENIGTAKAVNKGLKARLENEKAIKIDNDVVIHQSGWVEEMENVIDIDPEIGIVGLKRKDLMESPFAEDEWFRSQIEMLPHSLGQRWVIVEHCRHIMGTCQMLSPNLLNVIGEYVQPKVYGFDDSLLSLRSSLAGFKNVFLPHIHIDHIDTGGSDYQKWKESHASEYWQKYQEIANEYITKERSLYHED